jgi:hypothetical protein
MSRLGDAWRCDGDRRHEEEKRLTPKLKPRPLLPHEEHEFGKRHCQAVSISLFRMTGKLDPIRPQACGCRACPHGQTHMPAGRRSLFWAGGFFCASGR